MSSGAVIIIADKNGETVEEIESAIQDKLNEFHPNLEFDIIVAQDEADRTVLENRESPNLAVFIAGDRDVSDGAKSLVKLCEERNISILPVLTSDRDVRQVLPNNLAELNASSWNDEYERKRLLRTILIQLSLMEYDRRVFISYRRKDASRMAVQLYDNLHRNGFDVFLDRYDIDRGVNIQRRIHEAIDDKGFLLVLESPTAHESSWIDEEVSHALSLRDMAVLAVSWPNLDEEISSLPPKLRFDLKKSDITGSKGDRRLTEPALESLVDEVFKKHNEAVTKRRRRLMDSIVDEANDAAWSTNRLDNRHLVLTHSTPGGRSMLVGVIHRTPNVDDHFELSNRNPPNHLSSPGEKYLLHESQYVPSKKERLSKWVLRGKSQRQMNIYDFLFGGYL